MKERTLTVNLHIRQGPYLRKNFKGQKKNLIRGSLSAATCGASWQKHERKTDTTRINITLNTNWRKKKTIGQLTAHWYCSSMANWGTKFLVIISRDIFKISKFGSSHTYKRERNKTHAIKRSKANWIGHILRKKRLLKQVILRRDGSDGRTRNKT